jgi:hypothetical protein
MVVFCDSGASPGFSRRYRAAFMEVQGDQGKARPLERCPESFRRSLGKFPGGGIFLSSMVVSWASEAVQGWSWGLRAAGWRLESLDGRVLDTSGGWRLEAGG